MDCTIEINKESVVTKKYRSFFFLLGQALVKVSYGIGDIACLYISPFLSSATKLEGACFFLLKLLVFVERMMQKRILVLSTYQYDTIESGCTFKEVPMNKKSIVFLCRK